MYLLSNRFSSSQEWNRGFVYILPIVIRDIFRFLAYKKKGRKLLRARNPRFFIEAPTQKLNPKGLVVPQSLLLHYIYHRHFMKGNDCFQIYVDCNTGISQLQVASQI